MSETKKFGVWEMFGIALIPLISLFVILGFSIISWGLDPHIPLLIASFIAALTAMIILGYKWEDLQKGIIESIGLAMPAILILLVIGIVIGTWIIAGVVPGLIYYGLDIINPKFFLLSVLLLTSIISLATGSSWTAAGTVGIAMIGIAIAIDYNIGWTAGAVVSGAYFGDKMSPLSDTTNLAPAVAGTDVFKHIRSMLYTTVPSYIIAAIIYTIVGFALSTSGSVDLTLVEDTQTVLADMFNINPLIFIPPIAVIVMIILKVDALPALFVSALIGGVMAYFLNGYSVADILSVMHYGYEVDPEAVSASTGFAADSEVITNVVELLSRGGLDSMLWTVSLIICAMIFGGIMEASGLLQAVVDVILMLVFGYTSLVVASLATSLFMNVVAADQYLAIVLPGKMYRKSFVEEEGVEPFCFSRVLETGGTLTSPLVPWNTCGATMYAFLGVPAWGAGAMYGPYAVFNILNPIIEVVAAATKFGVFYADDKEKIKEVMNVSN